MSDYAKTSTYDLQTELQAERAYWNALVQSRQDVDTMTIVACRQRIVAIKDELRSRGALEA